MRRISGFVVVVIASTAVAAFAQVKERPIPRLVQTDGRYALLVDGAPSFLLAAQVNNSSGWPAMLPQVWPAMDFLHANTVEIPVYWEQFEPRQGQFDYSVVDTLLTEARAHHMRLVLLWFGTWKNGNPHYVEEGFQGLIDNRAVDFIQPDHGTSGGCRETKRIADYAWSRERIPTVIHMAESPLATIAAAHTASTMDAFVTMECHAVDFLSWWQQLVLGPQPFLNQGHVGVPDAPGLGVELNESVVKEHLRRPGYFDPATKRDDSFVGRGAGGPWPHFNVDGVWVNERTVDY